MFLTLFLFCCWIVFGVVLVFILGVCSVLFFVVISCPFCLFLLEYFCYILFFLLCHFGLFLFYSACLLDWFRRRFYFFVRGGGCFVCVCGGVVCSRFCLFLSVSLKITVFLAIVMFLVD